MTIPLDIDREHLRSEIRKEYREVAQHPDKGLHFHTGRTLASIVGYRDEWLDGVPAEVVARFAGTGNPFAVGTIAPGERSWTSAGARAST